jgi:hypothetical protein
VFVRAAEFWNAYLLSSFAMKKEEIEIEIERKARFFVDKAFVCCALLSPLSVSPPRHRLCVFCFFKEEVVVVVVIENIFHSRVGTNTQNTKHTNARGRRHETTRRTHARAVESEREDSL